MGSAQSDSEAFSNTSDLCYWVGRGSAEPKDSKDPNITQHCRIPFSLGNQLASDRASQWLLCSYGPSSLLLRSTTSDVLDQARGC